MKRITLILMLMTASLSFGQLKKIESSSSKVEEIGKIQPLGQPVHMDLTKSGDDYTFTYKDFDFKTIDQYRSFKLHETGSDLETLYGMIVEGFSTTPKDAIMVELSDNIVWLRFEKSFGMTLLRFSSSSDKTGNAQITQSNQFTKKQIEKLFGKSKK